MKIVYNKIVVVLVIKIRLLKVTDRDDFKMDQQKVAAIAEPQGEEDANMVTVVDESHLHDVKMIRDSDTTRTMTALTGITRPTVIDSPSLTENQENMQHRQQPQYSSQGSNSDWESADEGLQTEVRLRQGLQMEVRL